jgi:hypothetical protein
MAPWRFRVGQDPRVRKVRRPTDETTGMSGAIIFLSGLGACLMSAGLYNMAQDKRFYGELQRYPEVAVAVALLLWAAILAVVLWIT